MKRNSGLLMALLTVGVLLAVLLTLNLAKGGIWLIKGLDGKDGANGKSAYDLAVENGFTGSVTEWLASLGGRDGKSAYEIAVENGFRGSEKEWLLSLAFGENGKDGADGKDGNNGADGKNGQDGENGRDGVGIRSVRIDGNGHLLVTLTDGTQVDAGTIGGSISPTEENDFTRAQAAGYAGTLTEWLRGLQKGLIKDAGGKGLSVGDCFVNEKGHLTVLLSDGKTTLDAGVIPEDGFLSESVEQYNMRPRFEIVTLNWENPALKLRSTPDTESTSNVLTSYSAGKEFLCIGRGEVTEGDEFAMFLFPDGQIGYARSKFFLPKHVTVTGAEGMNLPEKLTLLAGKSMRLVGTEIVPWGDDSCFLAMEGEGLTVTVKDGIFTLSAETAGTYTLNVTLYRPMAVGIQLLDAKQVAVTVAAEKTLTGKKGLLIGDSRIAPGTGIPASLPKALTTRLPGVEWLGTQTNADGVKCEGFGGWSAANFLLTERIGENTNPFYNPAPEIKRFDFAYYMSNHPECRPDFVILNLGMNDRYSVRSTEYLNAIVASIHAYDPNIAVLVLTEYYMGGTATAYADNVVARQSAAYLKRLSTVFDGRESEKIRLLPNYLSVDPTADFADAAHLSSDGYAHEADVIATYLTDLFGT